MQGHRQDVRLGPGRAGVPGGIDNRVGKRQDSGNVDVLGGNVEAELS